MNSSIQNIFLRVKKINTKIMKFHSEYIKKCGVPHYTAMLMFFKESERENMTVGELAKKMAMPLPHVSAIVRKLEKEGYVEKQRDKNDNRVVKITLTQKGKDTQKIIRSAMGEASEKVKEKFTDEELQEFMNAFDTVEKFFERI